MCISVIKIQCTIDGLLIYKLNELDELNKYFFSKPQNCKYILIKFIFIRVLTLLEEVDQLC